FARLNAALAHDGVRLRADAGAQLARPLHLVFVGAPVAGDLAWHLRHRIEVGAGATLRLIEHHLAAGAHRHLDNSLLSIDIADGATLEHARIQHAADGATLFTRTEATLQADARYRRVDLELGGALSRHELNVRLAGERATLAAHGVLLATGRSHVDTRLGIEHVARDTTCELLWRGIGAGRGRAVFHGGITIHEGADGSDARLSNKNLLLSPTAEIDTQPVLVIHADEVQAAHGATVGQLDANALFYLRARGLPQDEAKQLLTAAFCREPLVAVEDAVVRDALLARLDAALEALSA
ncbi:MAG TPA: Fe-S cluster assembly protein SufD, partial [Luteimonas sp.]|nr:Fe-S cluster assembly protein SufD [Luteimonas sp.]